MRVTLFGYPQKKSQPFPILFKNLPVTFNIYISLFFLSRLVNCAQREVEKATPTPILS